MYKLISTITLTGTLLSAAAQATEFASNAAGGSVAVQSAATGASPLLVFRNPFAYGIQVLPLDTAAGMGNGIIVGKINGSPVAYVQGELILMLGKQGYTNVTPTGVSSNGYIVGYASSGSDVRGLFWSSYANAPIDMGGLGTLTYPTAVNSQAVAVGYYSNYEPGTTYPGDPTAFTWSTSGGIRSIAPPLAEQSQAFAISDSGYVAGMAWSSEQQAERWYPGTFQAGAAAFGNFAYGVLEDGTIFGETVEWNLENQPETIAPNAYSVVNGISAMGRRVGYNFGMPTQAWTVPPGGGGAEILPVPAGVTDSYANKVDTCGNILGSVSYPDGSTKAVLWTKLFCDSPLLLLR